MLQVSWASHSEGPLMFATTIPNTIGMSKVNPVVNPYIRLISRKVA